MALVGHILEIMHTSLCATSTMMIYLDISVFHLAGFQLLCVNRDGCHMWGRKCLLFSEHMISFPCGEFMILFIYYIYTT